MHFSACNNQLKGLVQTVYIECLTGRYCKTLKFWDNLIFRKKFAFSWKSSVHETLTFEHK